MSKYIVNLFFKYGNFYIKIQSSRDQSALPHAHEKCEIDLNTSKYVFTDLYKEMYSSINKTGLN